MLVPLSGTIIELSAHRSRAVYRMRPDPELTVAIIYTLGSLLGFITPSATFA